MIKKEPDKLNHIVKYLFCFLCFVSFALIPTKVEAANSIRLLSVDFDEEMITIDPAGNSMVQYSFDKTSWIPVDRYDGMWLIDLTSLSKSRISNIYFRGDDHTDILHIVRDKQIAAPFKGVYCGVDNAIGQNVGTASSIAVVDSKTKKTYADIKTIQFRSYTNAAWNTTEDKGVYVGNLEAFGGKLHLRSAGSSSSAIENGESIVKVTQPSKIITVSVPKKARKTSTKFDPVKGMITGVNKTFVYIVRATEIKSNGLFNGSIAGQTYYAEVTTGAAGVIANVTWRTDYVLNKVDTKQTKISLLDFPSYALDFTVYVPATAKAPSSLPQELSTPIPSSYGAIVNNISFDFASESIVVTDEGNEKRYEYTIIADTASGTAIPTEKTTWTALRAAKTSLTSKFNTLKKNSTLFLRKKGAAATSTTPQNIPSQYIAYTLSPRPVFTDAPKLDTVLEMIKMRVSSGKSEIEIASDSAFTSTNSSAQYTVLPATTGVILFPMQNFIGSKMYIRTKLVLPNNTTPTISPGGILYEGGTLSSKTVTLTIPKRAAALSPTLNFYNRKINALTYSRGTEYIVADSLATALTAANWSYVGAYAGKKAYAEILGVGSVGSTNKVYIRTRATASTLASAPLEITFVYTTAPVVTFDSTLFKLQGIKTTMCYSLDGGTTWKNTPYDDYALSTAEQGALTVGNGIQVKFLTDTDDIAVLKIPIS